ncbi:MAG: PLP-dependent aminotransferase family protein [Fusobacteriaceae bacterium]
MPIIKKNELNKSLYLQLYEKLKLEIIKKKVNSKFYSIRQVVIKYTTNINATLKVFKMLENNGYIYLKMGVGYFIKENFNFSIENEILPIMKNLHYRENEIKIINFSNGSPSSDHFPFEIYKKLIEKTLKNYGASLLGYQDIQGLKSLRKILADNFEKKGLFINENNILITTGTQQSLSIIINTFKDSSTKTIAISNPTYPNALNLFENMLKIKTFNLLKNGWDLLEFEKELKKEIIHLVYIMTNFQNPTGISWSLEKKQKLLLLAHKYNFYIIEDDCFSEFYYTKKPESLKALDKTGEEKVIYLKTFSKILMPGINISIIIMPPNIMRKAVLIKYTLDHGPSGLNQKVLEYFIKDKYYDKHLKKLNIIFKEKYHLIYKLLSTIQHIKVLNKPKGGFFIWLQLEEYINEEIFYEKCKINGVSLLPGNIFYSDRRDSGKIRLSFIYPSLDKIKEGIIIINNILQNYNS